MVAPALTLSLALAAGLMLALGLGVRGERPGSARPGNGLV